MIPLATIGFIVGAILFAFYAFSLRSYAASGGIRYSYIWAYYLMAITFLMWGVAAANGTQGSLFMAVLAGNACILAGSVLLLDTVVRDRTMVSIAAGVAVILFVGRLSLLPPAPYMEGGVLVFNTDPVVSAVYALLFAAIWLPASISVGTAVGAQGKVPEFTRLVKWLSGLSLLTAIFLPIARTPDMLVLAFVILAVCYTILIVVNFYYKGDRRIPADPQIQPAASVPLPSASRFMDTPVSPPAASVAPPSILGFTTWLRICMAVYAVLAVSILLGNNVEGAIGDSVRWLTIPMFIAGICLGLSLLGGSLAVATKKENSLMVRFLSPLVGLAVGSVVFFGGGMLAITAMMSNVKEGGS